MKYGNTTTQDEDRAISETLNNSDQTYLNETTMNSLSMRGGPLGQVFEKAQMNTVTPTAAPVLQSSPSSSSSTAQKASENLDKNDTLPHISFSVDKSDHNKTAASSNDSWNETAPDK